MNLGEAVLRITSRVQGMVAGLKTGASHVQKFAGQVTGAGRTMQGLGMKATLMAAAVSAAFLPMILQGAKFQRTMSEVQAVVSELHPTVDGAADAFMRLRTQVQDLGATTRWSASQVADAAKYLGMAGLRVAQIQKALPATLRLATAGSLELARAADIASDAMTAMRMGAEDLTRIVDVLAKTATSTNTTVEMLGEAFRYSLPVAAMYGQSIEDVTTMLGMFANAGIKASLGGTTYANMLSMLTKNSERAAKIMEAHGRTFAEINPEFNRATDIVRVLAEASLSAGEMFDIFGKRAVKGVAAAVGAIQDLERISDGMRDAVGVARTMEKIKIENVTGAFVILKSQLEAINVAIFDTIKEKLEGFLESVVNVTKSVIGWIKAHEEIVAKTGKAIGVFVGLAAAFGAVMMALAPVVITLGGLGSAIASVVGFILTLKGALVALATVAIAGILVPLILAMIQHWDKFKIAVANAWENGLKPFLTGLREGLVQAWRSVVKPAIDDLARAIGDLHAKFAALMSDVGMSRTEWRALGSILAHDVALAFRLVAETIELTIREIILLAGWFDRLVLRGNVLVRTMTGLSAATSSVMSTPQMIWLRHVVDVFEETVEAVENLVAEEKVLARQQEERIQRMREEVEASEFRLHHFELWADAAAKAAAIWEKGHQVAAVQLKDLDDLAKKYDLTKEGVSELVLALEDEIAATEVAIERAKEMGKVIPELYTKLDRLEDAHERVWRAILAQADATLDGTWILFKDAEAREKQRQSIISLAEAMQDWTKVQEEFARREQELLHPRLSGLDEELRKREEVHERTVAMLDARQTLLTEQQAEEIRRTGQLTEQKIAYYEKEFARVRQLRALANQEHLAGVKEVEEEALAARADFAEKAKAEDLKRRGFDLDAARLQRDRMLRLELERIDELEKEHGKFAAAQRDQLEHMARAKAAKWYAEQVKEIKGIKDHVIAAAEQEATIEEKLVDAIKNRVGSARELLAVHMALAMMRRQQYVFAMQAAEAMVAGERRLENLRERAGDAPGDKLRFQIRLAEERLRILQGIAGAEAGRARIEGAAAGQLAIAEEEAKGRLVQLRIAVENLIADIRNALLGVVPAFANAATQWANGFLAEWRNVAPQIVAAVQATMAQVSAVLDVNAAHSPSIADRLRGLNVAAAVAQPVGGIPAGGFVPAPRVGELNDNRRVDMVVNNNVDMDEVKRQIGRALGDAMQRPGEI